MKSESEFKVILVQFCPTPRDIKANITKVEKLLSKYNEDDKIDVIVLPEMALTGYIFDNVDDIKPCLEEYNKGLTFDFCSSIAKR
jgi:protein N-terminal amidase